jgi:alcohol dehydrogenase class IV
MGIKMNWILKKAAIRSIHYTTKFIYPLLKTPEPELYTGPGSIRQMPEIVKNHGVEKVLVVTDKGLTSLGLLDGMTAALEEEDIPYFIFDGVQPNPSIQNIEEGLQAYLSNKCDGIIAFGGGSPMDCAKMIGARAANPKKPVVKMRGKFRVWHKPPPIFAVPTTAGTGSETTVAAVVSNPETHEKFAVIDLKLVPPIAILDPELMVGLPPHITSTTGMDALTHAVEAYIGLHARKGTNADAEKAVKIIINDLEDVYKDGSNLEKRNQLAIASYHAGLAFTRAYVGYVHAIAHNMGGQYGVPHGLANAIILPYILEFSKSKINSQLAKLAVISGLGSEGEALEVLSQKFIDKVKNMNRNMDIPTHIKELQEKDFPIIIKRALSEASLDYPVPRLMTPGDCENLLRKLLPS